MPISILVPRPPQAFIDCRMKSGEGWEGLGMRLISSKETSLTSIVSGSATSGCSNNCLASCMKGKDLVSWYTMITHGEACRISHQYYSLADQKAARVGHRNG